MYFPLLFTYKEERAMLLSCVINYFPGQALQSEREERESG
jgi:hypothetical protein